MSRESVDAKAEVEVAEAAWRKLEGSRLLLGEGLLALRSTNGVESIASMLVTGDRTLALYVLPFLVDREIKELLPTLVYLASFSHGSMSRVRNEILRLPRTLLVQELPALVEPHLHGEEEYRRFLELYQLVDRDLLDRFAERARTSSDSVIRELGIDFSNDLEPG